MCLGSPITLWSATVFVSSLPSPKKAEDAVPVRIVAMLAPDQSLTLSTPHEAGATDDAVEIIRRADTLLIHEAAAGLTN
jgi:hypothetical protein